MQIKRSKDFKSGILFMFFGIAAMVFSARYQIGTSAKMGPGYFPFALGGVLAALGLVVMLASISTGKGEGKPSSFPRKPLLLVLSSVVLFGLLLRPLGLVVSTVILIILSSMASDEFRKAEAALNAFVLLVIVLTVFVHFLKFQIPVWPFFLKGWI